VWEDHLLPLLTCKDVARLGRTCKALGVVVREHFRDVGTIVGKSMMAALTTFPRARTMMIDVGQGCQDVEALVQWMHEEGRGRYLERLTTSDVYEDLVHEALRRGVLPSLKTLIAVLKCGTHRASLTEGLVADMHDLCLIIDSTGALEPQLAALSLVQQLSALDKLEVSTRLYEDDDDFGEWPPFIPPSLKALRIKLYTEAPSPNESLLRALPGMLEASGARLDRLDVILPFYFEYIGDGLVHLTQAVRCCSPSVRSFRFATDDWEILQMDDEAEDYASQVERLRVHFTEVMAGVSACRELEVLVLPRIEVEPLFPPGTAFGRLTHLQISDHERGHPPAAGVMGLWELMASRGLPALAKLSVRLEGRWGGVEEVRRRVAPALEAVAGTLTHLHLEKVDYANWRSDEVEVGYELGVAVGKLRRLKDLALDLSTDGGVYHAVAEGLAASGGEPPLSLLWRVSLPEGVSTNADQVASLLLPSVRVFTSLLADVPAAVLMACALRQAGYKHTWAILSGLRGPHGAASDVLSIALCNVVQKDSELSEASWTTLPDDALPGSKD
jgi:hypothetical protein